MDKKYSPTFQYKKTSFKIIKDGKFSFSDGGRITGWGFPDYIEHPDHPFFHCRSLTHLDEDKKITNKFSGSDDPEKFKKNKEKLGKDWKYYDKEISYEVNSSGYRTYEWDNINWKDSIVVLGCSNTFGVGVATDETIPYFLEKLSGRQVVNLGYPGGSNSVMVHNCAVLLEKFESPYAIVINWSSGDRYRHYFSNTYVDMGPWHHKKFCVQKDPIEDTDLSVAWETRYLSKANELTENYFLAKTAKIMCKDVKYVTMSYFEHMAHSMRADFFQGFRPGARDLIHPGVDTHERVANRILKFL